MIKLFKSVKIYPRNHKKKPGYIVAIESHNSLSPIYIRYVSSSMTNHKQQADYFGMNEKAYRALFWEVGMSAIVDKKLYFRDHNAAHRACDIIESLALAQKMIDNR